MNEVLSQNEIDNLLSAVEMEDIGGGGGDDKSVSGGADFGLPAADTTGGGYKKSSFGKNV